MPRRYPIFQFPNAPLIAAMLSGAAARTTHGRTARAAAVISSLAQLVWAYQEITDGANRFRRLLGIAAAARAGSELARITKPDSRSRSHPAPAWRLRSATAHARIGAHPLCRPPFG
jgi:hypothetical protein